MSEYKSTGGYWALTILPDYSVLVRKEHLFVQVGIQLNLRTISFSSNV